VDKDTWIVVADGARARILLHRLGTGLAPAIDRDLVATRLTNRDLESDRPGRSTSRVNRMRHGMTPSVDSHRLAQIELARAIAAELEAARTQGLQRVVLVAPPRALGDLREACSDGVRGVVVNEVAKDLTHLAIHDLAKRLDELLPH
jgi:protein required for attachment to host cells